MKTYQTFKSQSDGFKDVLETVKAAEKIAASSVHFLKQTVANLNQYADAIGQVMARLTQFVSDPKNPLLIEKKAGAKALVLFTTDKGLVDGLWHSLINELLVQATHYGFVICIGSKGEGYLREEGVSIHKSFTQIQDIANHETLAEITEYLYSNFIGRQFSRVDILYPRFLSLSEQVPVIVPYLPFRFKANALPNSVQPKAVEALGLPIFEPSKKELFHWLLKKHIELFFAKIAQETKLSELSARTTSMENARVKTDQLIQKITYDFLKTRRQTATQRQLESFSAHNTL
jgi:F-type H+-transporting ATPase subunit gamma